MLESKGEKVFDVNEKDNQGMTPLYYAAENKNSDIIAALINKDANLGIKGNEGKTPMTILMEKKEKFTIVVKILGLKLKSKNHCDRDLHAIDRNRNSLLHYASSQGKPELVETLIKSGLSMHAKNDNGETAADIARNKFVQESEKDKESCKMFRHSFMQTRRKDGCQNQGVY